MLLLGLIALLAYLPGLASLPPIDRDEARYTQATVQMVETGDLIDIRFQEDARHKKPAGAYWAQLASLTLTGQIDDVQRGERAIWAHRLPSVLGALIAVWATYLGGLALFGRREALWGAGLLALSVSLVFEAHIAKTDAMLAGACAVVLYGLAARKAWPVWMGIAAGLLLKGPLILAIAALGLIGSALWDRSWDRVRATMKPMPIIVALLIALPWFVAIGIRTDGAFFAEALGRDFGGKIAGAQESHGGAPGYYLLTSLVMFWPGILAVPVAILFAWRNRTDRGVRLLLAWIIPMWIGLELVPTKLPHYTLPLYPALALLAGAGWVRLVDAGWLRLSGLVLMGVVGVLLAALVAATHWDSLSVTAVVLCAVILSALVMLSALWFARQDVWRGLIAGGLFLATGFGLVLANSPLLDLTPRLVAQIPAQSSVVSPDYREPSLVFLAGTQTRLTREARPGDTLILSSETTPPACAEPVVSVAGSHYAKGREVELLIHRTAACRQSDLDAWARSDA
ncbi:glycosyl transferase [Algimonas porphyrae]|uniref:Glycosyl transferase n=2 Tax=Algimonas porphyrae TaxID=1128113 RepID=A0ABQ5UYV4_9PROT|nr:glycosyl transferase [Algimonas porphyrae]